MCPACCCHPAACPCRVITWSCEAAGVTPAANPISLSRQVTASCRCSCCVVTLITHLAGVGGPLSRCCEAVLRVLRRHSEALLQVGVNGDKRMSLGAGGWGGGGGCPCNLPLPFLIMFHERCIVPSGGPPHDLSFTGFVMFVLFDHRLPHSCVAASSVIRSIHTTNSMGKSSTLGWRFPALPPGALKCWFVLV